MISSVKIGFVPSYRFRYSEWCQKMRDDSLATFAQVDGMDVVVPQESPDGALDAVKGLTPHGMVHNLDEAEAVTEYFQSQKVDGLILCPLDFGDERSAARSLRDWACQCCSMRPRSHRAMTTPV